MTVPTRAQHLKETLGGISYNLGAWRCMGICRNLGCLSGFKGGRILFLGYIKGTDF